MNLKIVKVLQDNRYSVQLVPENWSLQDLSLIEQFGEPTVEVGGTTSLVPAFDFPTDPRLIKSGFPYTRVLDGDADVDAEDKMTNWITEMQNRFTVVLADLRAKSDGFSGTLFVNI